MSVQEIFNLSENALEGFNKKEVANPVLFLTGTVLEVATHSHIQDSDSKHQLLIDGVLLSPHEMNNFENVVIRLPGTRVVGSR